MSAPPSAPYSMAATRVFGTMELLEMILLEVAYAEVSGPGSTPEKQKDRNLYIRSPIILRAVNHDFLNSIDSSVKLLRLRLNVVHPQATQDYFSLPYFLRSEAFGPLTWLGEQHFIWAIMNKSSFRDGALLLCVSFFDTARSDKEEKIRENPDASWRELSCWTDGRLLSKVDLQMSYVKHSACRRKSHTMQLPTQGLGPAPTLGMLYDAIYRAKVTLGMEKLAGDRKDDEEE